MERFKSPAAPQMQSSLKKPQSESERIERRRNRFTNSSAQSPASPHSANETPSILIGTCDKLEKDYFRLTSAPHPSTVRSLATLERAFTHVMDKYQLTHDWPYANNQLKSIRQDLMVQSIRNDFTVRVYEENARLALEMAEREQFVQCQSQLEILYDSDCDRTHFNEFLVYRLLFALLLNDYRKCARTLIDIQNAKRSTTRLESLAHLNTTLEFCSAFRRQNYTQVFRLYESLPRLARCLVDIFLHVHRQQLIRIFVWGFAPTVPLELFTQLLAYDSDGTCKDYLKSVGVILTEESKAVDCKASRINLEKVSPAS